MAAPSLVSLPTAMQQLQGLLEQREGIPAMLPEGSASRLLLSHSHLLLVRWSRACCCCSTSH